MDAGGGVDVVIMRFGFPSLVNNAHIPLIFIAMARRSGTPAGIRHWLNWSWLTDVETGFLWASLMALSSSAAYHYETNRDHQVIRT
jgi:hypothetical protein